MSSLEMPSTWSNDQYQQFWSTRKWVQIGRDDNMETRSSEYIANKHNSTAILEDFCVRVEKK